MQVGEWRLLGMAMASHGLVHTYMLLIPLMIPLWMEEFSVNESGIGLVATAAYLLFGLTALPSGFASDRLGSRGLIALSMGGAGLSLVLTYLTTDLVSLTLSLVLVGLFSGLYHPAGLSLVSRKMMEKERALGYHGAGGNIGIGLGPLAAALLLTAFSWREVFLLSALPGILLCLLWLKREEGSKRLRHDGVRVTKNVSLRTLFNVQFLVVVALYFLYGLCYRGSVTFIPTFIDKALEFPSIALFGNELTAGRYLFVAMLLVGALGQTAAGYLAERRGAGRTLALAFGAMVLMLVAIPLTARLSFVASLLVFGFFLFSVQPLQNSLVASVTRGEVRGFAYGMTFLSAFGFGAFGAALAGFLAVYSGYMMVYLTLAGTASVALALAAIYAVRFRQREDEMTERVTYQSESL